MDWFRFYTSTLNSAKVQELPDKLFKAWVNFMCVARVFGGVLPNHREIAFRLRCSPEQALKYTHELKQARLLDEIPGGRFVMHDWDEYQFKSDDAAGRKREYRTGQKQRSARDRARDISGTSPGLEQNRTEQRQTSVRAHEFAAAYPDRSDERGTVQQYISLVEPSEEEAVFACLQRYKASDQVARGFIQAGPKWLQSQKENAWRGQWKERERSPYEGVETV